MYARLCNFFLLVILGLASPGPSLAQEKGLSADELVKKAIEARGGAAQIKAVRAERVTGTISFAPGVDGPFQVELKRPLKLRMEVTVQEQTIVRVYDGHGSGWTVNPFAPSGAAGPVAMTGDDLKNITDESDFDGPLVDYQTKGNQIEAAGKDEVEGKPALKLKLTTKAGDVRTYYFDAATFLLLKWEGVHKTGDQGFPVESFFRDYRELSGLKFPFEIDTDSPGSNRKQKLNIDKIELNPELDDARFGKPAEPRSPAPVAAPPPKRNP